MSYSLDKLQLKYSSKRILTKNILFSYVTIPQNKSLSCYIL